MSVLDTQMPRQRAVVYSLAIVLLIIVAALLVARTVASTREVAIDPSDPRAFTIPRSPEIEEKYGIRFTFLAVTGDGGLVDLRYRVVDEGRAKNFGHFTETAPRLIVERSGAVIDVTKMGLHNHYAQLGRTYFVIYRNTDNAIQPGDKVTIAINDLYLKNVVAR
jgi:hypothetical protein